MSAPTYNEEHRPDDGSPYPNDKVLSTTEKELAYSPSVSSDDRSIAISSSLPAQTSHLTGPSYNLNHTSFPWRNVTITHLSGAAAYHVEVSEATPNKPDILLRAPDRDGRVVGRNYFRLKRSMRIGIGESELDSQWVELKQSSMIKLTTFAFSFDGRDYLMSRTHSAADGVNGANKVGMGSFKVVEKAGKGERVVAVYVEGMLHPAWMKGTVRFVEGLGEDLEKVVLMGFVGWREKMRRRAAYAGQPGGGGGGG